MKCKAYNSYYTCSESFFNFLSQERSNALQINLSSFNLAHIISYNLTMCLELGFRQVVGEQFCLSDGFPRQLGEDP